jgi:hypothetical protein
LLAKDWAVLWFVLLCLWFLGLFLLVFSQLHDQKLPTLGNIMFAPNSLPGVRERDRKREKERERERKRGDLNHLLVHQWIRSAIRDSQQPTSPIGFLFLKLSSPPCDYFLKCLWFLGLFQDLPLFEIIKEFARENVQYRWPPCFEPGFFKTIMMHIRFFTQHVPYLDLHYKFPSV